MARRGYRRPERSELAALSAVATTDLFALGFVFTGIGRIQPVRIKLVRETACGDIDAEPEISVYKRALREVALI